MDETTEAAEAVVEDADEDQTVAVEEADEVAAEEASDHDTKKETWNQIVIPVCSLPLLVLSILLPLSFPVEKIMQYIFLPYTCLLREAHPHL